MAKKLNSLRIKGFRGATSQVDFSFDSEKPVILIFGENGTGKSTIVDALDFVCNQRAGSLVGRQETNPRKHLPSLDAPAADLSVVLECGGSKWSASLDSAKPVVRGSSVCPDAAILRRSKLLDFIDVPPADRYKALAAFIDVSKVEKSEQSLREARKNITNEIDSATQSKADAVRNLELVWKAEGCPAPSAVQWAEAKAGEDLGTLLKTQNEIGAVLTAFGQARDAEVGRSTWEAEWTAAEAALECARQELNTAESESAAAESQLLDLLGQAQRYLEAHPDLALCPVCEQPIDPAELSTRIIARRKMARAVEEASVKVRQTQKIAGERRTALDSREEHVIREGRRLAELVRASEAAVPQGQPVIWSAYPLLFGEADGNLRKPAADEVGLMLERLGPIEPSFEGALDSVGNDIANLRNIQTLSRNLAQQSKRLEDLQPLRQRLDRALQIMESKRRGYVEGVLDSVTDRVEALYSRLHPDENVGNIKFLLDPDKRGSLSIRGSFETQDDIPPQAYYSESHLDTLGICIFLALAERYASGDRIIVLDDVLTSTDQGHLDRFIELIHDECAVQRQVVLTTHYRPLRDRYRYAHGPLANVQLIELLPWTRARGVRHTNTKPEIDDLRRLLTDEPLDRQALASKAGVLLEATLDKITLLYGCRVRRKPSGDYTLGELLDGLESKLRKRLQTGAEPLQGPVNLAEALDGLASLTWIRNQVGAHFNYKGMEISDKKIVEFGRATLELLDLLVCPKCGDLPRRHDGSAWRCSCRTRWMTPLAIPGDPLSEVASL
ncbi:MAG: AAA family ATPase [Bryobacterales bacterium]|nr:AAA family ATPase [Bryobacterales bacterium]